MDTAELTARVFKVYDLSTVIVRHCRADDRMRLETFESLDATGRSLVAAIASDAAAGAVNYRPPSAETWAAACALASRRLTEAQVSA